jgi:hypothetical protein
MAKRPVDTLEPEAAPAAPTREMPSMDMAELWREFRHRFPAADRDADAVTPQEIERFVEYLGQLTRSGKPQQRALAGNPDAITYSTDPEQKPSGVNIQISGTMAMNTGSVVCHLLFEDDMGNVQNQSITANTANLGTSNATWQTVNFTLPYNNWRYLFMADFMHTSPPSSSGKDHFLFTGTPS